MASASGLVGEAQRKGRGRTRSVTGGLLASTLVAGILWVGAPAASAANGAQVVTGRDHTCALTKAGGVWCWGENVFGQAGNGTRKYTILGPTDVVGLASGVATISAGTDHTCAVTKAGAAKCWGNNDSGGLGDGSVNYKTRPVDVKGLGTGVAAISAGHGYTCVLMDSGGVKCWGTNEGGQLGNGSDFDSKLPVNVQGLTSGVKAVSAGDAHACALTNGGGVKCWGFNKYGQLGDGSTEDRWAPVDVVGLGSGVKAISAGGLHTCAVMTAGGVKCWGRNEHGRLGDGSESDAHEPVDVDLQATAVSAGYRHTCAVSSGGVRCWGMNAEGQIGDGTTTKRLDPAAASGLGAGVKAVAAGGHHSCFLGNGGKVGCWGGGEAGQLGNYSAKRRLTYVLVPRFGGPRAPTALGIGVPKVGYKGYRTPVIGKLFSDIRDCVKGQRVTLERKGAKAVTTKVRGSGYFRFSFKVARTDPVKKAVIRVRFARTELCRGTATRWVTIGLTTLR